VVRVIGTMNTPDRDFHEPHLGTCATCEAEARNHADAVEALSETVVQVEPPVRLQRAIATHARFALAFETSSRRAAVRGTGSRLPQ
jgi:hypothetical protein